MMKNVLQKKQKVLFCKKVGVPWHPWHPRCQRLCTSNVFCYEQGSKTYITLYSLTHMQRIRFYIFQEPDALNNIGHDTFL